MHSRAADPLKFLDLSHAASPVRPTPVSDRGIDDRCKGRRKSWGKEPPPKSAGAWGEAEFRRFAKGGHRAC